MSIRQKTRLNFFYKDNMFSSWISQSTWNHCFLLTHFNLLVFAYQYETPAFIHIKMSSYRFITPGNSKKKSFSKQREKVLKYE